VTANDQLAIVFAAEGYCGKDDPCPDPCPAPALKAVELCPEVYPPLAAVAGTAAILLAPCPPAPSPGIIVPPTMPPPGSSPVGEPIRAPLQPIAVPPPRR
jgi:hypothetical protein